MDDFALLDNPIWSALTSVHHSIARKHGLARRYPSDVSPLAALAEPTSKAFDDLAELVGSRETVALFTTAPLDVPQSWDTVRTRWIDQMICTVPIASPPPSITPVLLSSPDIPEMLALTAATEPGPFLARTIDMGRYFGIRSSEGRLIAMAGERLRLDALTEVSAVCTDPNFRGGGFGRAIVAHVAALAFRENKIPFLHVKTENTAKIVYEKVGFRVRREIRLTVIRLR